MLLRLAVLTLAGLLALPAAAQDAAEIVLRLNRLENQARQLSGQIERLEYENAQLKQSLRKFQEDVEFRFQEGRPGQAGAQASPRALPGPDAPRPQAQAAPSPAAPPPAARAPRRGDAFDPATQPEAPGAPRPLGSASAPAAPVPQGALPAPTIGSLLEDGEEDESGGPLDLNRVGPRPPAVASGAQPAPRPTAPSVAATSASGDSRTDYEAAYAYVLNRQYEQAEMSLRQFLQSHPRDRLVPDATYWLGESYLARNRPREAAEQFLKISTTFASASKAPEALLKLGVSLHQLGAKDQACATFAEVGRKYPQASPTLRQGLDREQKRAKCA